MIDRGALCLGVEGLASNRDGSSEGARSVSMTGEEVERWGRDTYDCETWSRFDWCQTQTHNCSQSCANELAVTTHLGGYQHALIELADALTRHRCSTSLPQCHNAGRGSRGATPRSRLPCQKANRERPQPPNFRNRTMGSFLATYSHSAPGAFTQRHARLCRAKSL